jgi:hypothetical protein
VWPFYLCFLLFEAKFLHMVAKLMQVELWGHLGTDNLQSGTERAGKTCKQKKKKCAELRGRSEHNKELARK